MTGDSSFLIIHLDSIHAIRSSSSEIEKGSYSFVFLEVIHDKFPYLFMISQAPDDIFCYFYRLSIE